MPFLICFDIGCSITVCVFHTKGKDIAGKISCDARKAIHIPVDYQCSVIRKIGCKGVETLDDLINATEEIQMIGIYIQDNADVWIKCMETNGICTRLSNKVIGMTNSYIATDGI